MLTFSGLLICISHFNLATTAVLSHQKFALFLRDRVGGAGVPVLVFLWHLVSLVVEVMLLPWTRPSCSALPLVKCVHHLQGGGGGLHVSVHEDADSTSGQLGFQTWLCLH